MQGLARWAFFSFSLFFSDARGRSSLAWERKIVSQLFYALPATLKISPTQLPLPPFYRYSATSNTTLSKRLTSKITFCTRFRVRVFPILRKPRSKYKSARDRRCKRSINSAQVGYTSSLPFPLHPIKVFAEVPFAVQFAPWGACSGAGRSGRRGCSCRCA